MRLYAPGSPVCPYEEGLSTNSSRIDLDAPGVEFAGFAAVPFEEAVLEAGDMLYIPPMHWHYVKALTTSCSLSHWFELPGA